MTVRDSLKSEPRVLSLGDLRWDHLIQGPHLGGSAAAFACRMAALGRCVEFAGAVGADAYGKEAVAQLSGYGVQTSLVQVDRQLPTSEARIEVSSDGIPLYLSRSNDAAGQLAETRALMNRADEFDVLYFNSFIQSSVVSGTTLQKFISLSPPSFKVYELCGMAPETTRPHLEAAFEVASVVCLRGEDVSDVCAILGLPELEPALLAAAIPERYGVSYCVVANPRQGAIVASIVGEQVFVASHQSDPVDLLGWHEAYVAGFVHHVLRGSNLERCSTAGMQYADMVAQVRGACAPLHRERLEVVDQA